MPKPLITPAVTPIESSEDEDEKPAYPFSTSPRFQSTQLTMESSFYIDDADSDMDMADAQPSTPPTPSTRSRVTKASPKPSPFTLLPLPSTRNSQDHANGGRIPTPIYGYFRSIDTGMEVDAPDNLYGPTFSLPRQELDHESQIRRRRLPTPISEDEAMDSPTTITMLDRLDMATDIFEKQPSMERQRKTSTWPAAHGIAGAKGGKTTLSMGYRADCEKCRTRVPGHYNHVIRSPGSIVRAPMEYT